MVKEQSCSWCGINISSTRNQTNQLTKAIHNHQHRIKSTRCERQTSHKIKWYYLKWMIRYSVGLQQTNWLLCGCTWLLTHVAFPAKLENWMPHTFPPETIPAQLKHLLIGHVSSQCRSMQLTQYHVYNIMTRRWNDWSIVIPNQSTKHTHAIAEQNSIIPSPRFNLLKPSVMLCSFLAPAQGPEQNGIIIKCYYIL